MLASFLSLSSLLTAAPVLRDDWVDPSTGHRVIRLSRIEGTNESFYFHQNAFTPLGDKMVFGNIPIGFSNRLVELNWSTGKLEPLTVEGVHGGLVAHRSANLYFQRGPVLAVEDLNSHQTRAITLLPKGWGISTVNANETLAAGTFVDSNLKIDHSGPKSAWFNKIYEAQRPQCLFTVNLLTGETNLIHRYPGWLGHIQFSPTDPSLLMFCHEGPWDKVDRIWHIRADGTELRLMHQRSMPMEIAGHEFWSPDGKTVWFDLQVPRSQNFFLAGVDVATGAEVRYPLERNQWSVHYNISADQELFAGDGGGPGNVAHATDGKWIWLFTPQSGHTFRAEKLVNMANHDYLLEPNVNFTPNGKWIVFRGNFDGMPQVYAVEVKKASAP
jgi:oligogalacturonide lyase